jgi:hypothetical protein
MRHFFCAASKLTERLACRKWRRSGSDEGLATRSREAMRPLPSANSCNGCELSRNARIIRPARIGDNLSSLDAAEPTLSGGGDRPGRFDWTGARQGQAEAAWAKGPI